MSTKASKGSLNKDDDSKTIHFIYNRWSGKVKMEPHEVLTLDDIKAGLEPIPRHQSVTAKNQSCVRGIGKEK